MRDIPHLRLITYTQSKKGTPIHLLLLVGLIDDIIFTDSDSSILCRQLHQRFRQTITSARFGGPIEATKRILAQLPISAQSFSASPYLDQALFSYDDHRVSVMERPKACGEVPIR